MHIHIHMISPKAFQKAISIITIITCMSIYWLRPQLSMCKSSQMPQQEASQPRFVIKHSDHHHCQVHVHKISLKVCHEDWYDMQVVTSCSPILAVAALSCALSRSSLRRLDAQQTWQTLATVLLRCKQGKEGPKLMVREPQCAACMTGHSSNWNSRPQHSAAQCSTSQHITREAYFL